MILDDSFQVSSEIITLQASIKLNYILFILHASLMKLLLCQFVVQCCLNLIFKMWQVVTKENVSLRQDN